MLTPSLLLLATGLLGAFDIVYFHLYRCGLGERAESRAEVAIHVAFALVFALELVIVPSVRFGGHWYAAFVAVLVADVVIAMSDVAVEPASRRSQGGLPAGEYFVHAVLFVLAGAYLHAVVVSTAGWASLPTAVTWAPTVPLPVRVVLLGLAASAVAGAAYEAIGILAPSRLHAAVAAMRRPVGAQGPADRPGDSLPRTMSDTPRERIELLEAAISCFAASGFEATTMRGIADAAGVPLERAFLHYPSKHAFALAMYQGLVADLTERLVDLPRGTVAERFAALLAAKLDLLDTQRSAMRALVSAAVDAEGPLGVLSSSTAAIRARMAGAAHATVAGATDAPEDATQLARVLYGVHLAVVLLWTQDADGRMARAAAALCGELLSALGPMLRAPLVAARLSRLETVFGDRLSPVVSADAERRARWILARLMDHRRLLPGRPEGPPTEEELAPHLPLLRAAIADDQPIALLLPAFPAKSPNPEKVLGALPDMAEEVALRSLQSLCDELGTAHPPGVRLTLCSDGLVFADVVGVTDEDVAAYGRAIDRTLAELPALGRFDLSHAFGAVAPSEARRRLISGWGEEEAALLRQVEASASLRAQLDGLHRFMFEDGVALDKETSRTQVRKQARGKAVAVLLRSRAWGRLLASCFPRALRLSIHPQPAVSDKLGIHLLPTRDAWLTPWHGVALLEGDRFQLVKRAEAEARGAARVDVDGRPSHYVVAS